MTRTAQYPRCGLLAHVLQLPLSGYRWCCLGFRSCCRRSATMSPSAGKCWLSLLAPLLELLVAI